MLKEYVVAQDRQRAMEEAKRALWSQWNNLSIGPVHVTPVPGTTTFAPPAQPVQTVPPGPGLKR